MAGQWLHPDGAVVREVLAGRRERFEVLVRRHIAAVRAVALARTGNRTDADDVVQETFLAAFRALDSLREPAAFRGWLLTICRNTAFQWRRRERQTEAPLDDEPMVQPDPARAELHEMLRAHLAALEPDAREILLLHYFSGYTAREIGVLFGISHDAARKRMQRAREALSDRMLTALRDDGSGDDEKAVRSIMIGVSGLSAPVRDAASAGSMGAMAWASLALTAAVLIGGAYVLWRGGAEPMAMAPEQRDAEPPAAQAPPAPAASRPAVSANLPRPIAPRPAPVAREASELRAAAAPAPAPDKPDPAEPFLQREGVTYWRAYTGPSGWRFDPLDIARGAKDVGIYEVAVTEQGMELLGVSGDVSALQPYFRQTDRGATLRFDAPKPVFGGIRYEADAYDGLLEALRAAPTGDEDEAARELGLYVSQYPEQAGDLSALVAGRDAAMRRRAALALGHLAALASRETVTLQLAPGPPHTIAMIGALSAEGPSTQRTEPWALTPIYPSANRHAALRAEMKERLASIVDLLEADRAKRGGSLAYALSAVEGWPEDFPYEIVSYESDAAKFFERLERAYEAALATLEDRNRPYAERLMAMEAALESGWGNAFPRGMAVLTARHRETGVEGRIAPDLFGRLGVDIGPSAALETNPALLERAHIACLERMKEIGLRILQFAENHEGHLPPGWLSMAGSELNVLELVTCPLHDGAGTIDAALVFPARTTEDVVAIGAAVLGIEPSEANHAAILAAVPLAVETAPNHDGGRMAVFMDGHAEYVPEAEANARITPFMTYVAAQ